MDKKKSPKLEALMQLRQMVEDLINDDFKSSKMPKLMAMKITKVTPLTDEAEEAPEGLSLSEAVKSAAESEDSKLGTEDDSMAHEMAEEESEAEMPCPECGEMDCDCPGMKAMDEMPKPHDMSVKVESPAVLKLKKLLGK